MTGRTTPLLAAAALLAAALLSGCGSRAATGTATPQGPPPPVGIPLATKLLQQYTAANTAANAAGSATGIDAIETAPAALGSKAGLTIAKAQGIAIPTAAFVQPRFVFPRINGFPTYFVAIAPLLQSGSVSPAPKYLLFVQQSAGAPWKVAYYPYPDDPTDLPELEQDARGGAPAVTGPTGLLADPAVLAAAYEDDALGHPDATPPLAATRALSQELAGGMTAGVAALRSKGGSFRRELVGTGSEFPGYLLRTKDGGVLAFTAVRVRDTMTATAPRATVPLDPGSREAALAGSPTGAKAHSFTVERLDVFLSYVPPLSSPGNGVQLLAYADYPLSVK